MLDARPDVLNHNTETVPRLYRAVRSGARYERTLDLLENAKKFSPGMVTKSGVMVGLGEATEELIEVFRDLGEREVDILTVGQYLRPSQRPSADCALLHARGVPVHERRSAPLGISARGVGPAGALELSCARAGGVDRALGSVSTL